MANQIILTGQDYSRQQNVTKKIRQLQNNNRDLEQMVRQRIQSLKLQLNLDKIRGNSQKVTHTNTIIEQYIDSQLLVRSFLSEELMNSQIKIQQQCDMKEIIKNYEKRIADLRSVLINKQGEITIQAYQRKRDSIVRRQNMELINIFTNQKLSIGKYLKQIKKLNVQIQAMQFTIRNNQKCSKKDNQQFRKYESTRKDQKQQPSCTQFQNTLSKSKMSMIQKQIILKRVYEMIAEEQKTQLTQDQQIINLKRQFDRLHQTNSILQKKYKKIVGSKERILQNNKHQKEGQNKYQNYILTQLLQEQQQSEPKIFIPKDHNKTNNQITSKRTINYRQRRSKIFKQN